jgi:hypothetical protein
MNQHFAGSGFKPWSPREVTIAAEMWQRLFVDVHGEEGPVMARTAVFDAIGLRLERSRMAVWQRFRYHGASFNAGGRAKVSANAMAERSARAEASYRRDLTAEIFGDPPPGYSALDRRQR